MILTSERHSCIKLASSVAILGSLVFWVLIAVLATRAGESAVLTIIEGSGLKWAVDSEVYFAARSI